VYVCLNGRSFTVGVGVEVAPAKSTSCILAIVLSTGAFQEGTYL
jgi:hypothetical protein